MFGVTKPGQMGVSGWAGGSDFWGWRFGSRCGGWARGQATQRGAAEKGGALRKRQKHLRWRGAPCSKELRGIVVSRPGGNAGAWGWAGGEVEVRAERLGLSGPLILHTHGERGSSQCPSALKGY